MGLRHPLVLIRHAQAEHHVRDITGGWTDTRLTSEGMYQSNLLAERLDEDLDGLPIHLGTSSLQRARQTASIIAQKMGVDLQIYTSLADLNNGLAAGKTHAQAKSFAIPPSEPLVDWQPYPQAETWREFFQRVSGFMDQFIILQDMPAVLVTHSANIHVIIAWWLELSIESRTHFDVVPASITVLKMGKRGEKSIERLNDSAHLHVHGMHNPIKL